MDWLTIVVAAYSIGVSVVALIFGVYYLYEKDLNSHLIEEMEYLRAMKRWR